MARRFLAAALVAGAVLAGGSVLGAGSPAVASTDIAPIEVSAVLRVMPLGDSITYGVGSTTSDGYRAPLWSQLAEESGYGLDFVGSVSSGRVGDPQHEGHPGWSIRRIAAQATRWVTVARPDVILLHVGTNDIRTAASAAGAPQRLSELIDQLRAAAPRAIVLVAKIVPSADAATDARAVAYNRHIPGIVAGKDDTHVRVVDLHSALDPATDLHDWLHPNDAGYAKMAAAWRAALRDLLPVPRGLALGTTGCMDVGTGAAGAAVRGQACDGSAGQRWSREGLTLRALGKCLDADGGPATVSTRVHLWRCHGGSSQAWRLRGDGSIYNPASNQCLAAGDRLVARPCDRGVEQRFATA